MNPLPAGRFQSSDLDSHSSFVSATPAHMTLATDALLISLKVNCQADQTFLMKDLGLKAESAAAEGNQPLFDGLRHRSERGFEARCAPTNQRRGPQLAAIHQNAPDRRYQFFPEDGLWE